MRKYFFLTIALLCAVVQGAWAQTEVSTESALHSAIADGAHIRLTDNITLSAYLKIGRNASNEAVAQTVTIDLNGHTLCRSGLTSAQTDGHVIKVFGVGTLTITDSGTGLDKKPTTRGIYIHNGHKVVIK